MPNGPFVSLAEDHAQLLIQLYREARRTSDDLPYTEEFENLYRNFLARSGLHLTRHEVWRALAHLRKAGRLTRKRR